VRRQLPRRRGPPARSAARWPRTSGPCCLGLFRKATGADAFKDGIALVVAAMLQMPQFLYLVESGKPVPGSTNLVELGDYEVAARLSFLLWDSLPDATLLDAAARADAHRRRRSARRPSGCWPTRRRAPPSSASRASGPALRVWRAGEKASKDFTEPLATAMQTEFDLDMQGAFLDGVGTLKTCSPPRPPTPTPPGGVLWRGGGGRSDGRRLSFADGGRRTRAGS
jgi:hypothetical protein